MIALPSSLHLHVGKPWQKQNQESKHPELQSHAIFFSFSFFFFICHFSGEKLNILALIWLPERNTHCTYESLVWVENTSVMFLKTLQMTSTVDKCHQDKTQAHLVLVFIRFLIQSTSEVTSHKKGQSKETTAKERDEDWKQTSDGLIFCSILCIYLHHRCLHSVMICFWKSGFTPWEKWKPHVPLHVLTRLRYTSIKRDSVETEGGWKEGGPWHEPAACFPKTRTLQSLAVHTRRRWKEKLFHIMTCGICFMASGCAFWGLKEAKNDWQITKRY